MLATYRVKNAAGNTVGFIIDDNFYSYDIVKSHISNIENLYLTRNNIIKTKKGKLNEIPQTQLNKLRYEKICRENPIKRDVQNEFAVWKENRHNDILYVEGARQTGKTTELKKFAYNNYEQVIYVNLSVTKHLNDFIATVINAPGKVFGLDDFCKLTSEHSQYVNNDSTILIIDEIQDSVIVYNSLRTLQAELKCHIAVTGSFLGRTLNKEFFIPAGNTYNVEMTPLSFTEFCRVFNADKLLATIKTDGTSSENDYNTLMGLYNSYKEIGGYPRVVTTFLKTQSTEACYDILADLLDRFIQESIRYINSDKSKIVFENMFKAAAIMQAREKKGTDSNIAELTKKIIDDSTKSVVNRKEVNGAISWLVYNGVLGTCDLYNQGNVLEILPEKRIYFRDCGILNYVIGTTAIKEDARRGLIAETFAYNELYRIYRKRTKLLKGDKPCCSVFNDYELDFMLVDKNDIKYGIEIKSGTTNNPKTLMEYRKNGFINIAIVAENANGSIKEKWRSIPIYTVGARFPYRD